VSAVIYTIPLSHPAIAAIGMLRQQGVDYREVSLVPGAHPVLLRALGFRGGSVPAMRLDGRRVQGSRAISAALHARAPDRELFPSDPEAAARVAAAERWGEQVLQAVPRRLIRRGLADHLRQRQWFAGLATPFPAPQLFGALLTPVALLFALRSRASRARTTADLDELPSLLDRVDGLLADGTIGGERLNAADWQIGTSVRVLHAMQDVRPLVAGRPAEAHARRVVPDYPEIPAALGLRSRK
jgi:glutathione S-transferase